MAWRSFGGASLFGRPRADQPVARMKEPAWHRRLRAKRSQARLQARLADQILALASHHGSAVPALVAGACRKAAEASSPQTSAIRRAILQFGLPGDAVMEVDGELDEEVEASAAGQAEALARGSQDGGTGRHGLDSESECESEIQDGVPSSETSSENSAESSQLGEQRPPLRLSVQGKHGTVKGCVKPHTPLRVAMKEYCKIFSLRRSDVSFMVDGELVTADEAAGSLGLEDDDVIYVATREELCAKTKMTATTAGLNVGS